MAQNELEVSDWINRLADELNNLAQSVTGELDLTRFSGQLISFRERSPKWAEKDNPPDFGQVFADGYHLAYKTLFKLLRQGNRPEWDKLVMGDKQ